MNELIFSSKKFIFLSWKKKPFSPINFWLLAQTTLLSSWCLPSSQCEHKYRQEDDLFWPCFVRLSKTHPESFHRWSLQLSEHPRSLFWIMTDLLYLEHGCPQLCSFSKFLQINVNKLLIHSRSCISLFHILKQYSEPSFSLLSFLGL